MAQTQSQVDARNERIKYVRAFNTTMVEIWKEQITKLRVIDTGSLYNSVYNLGLTMNADATDLELLFGFNQYGIYVDKGTGREIYRGNPGDIGRDKVRVAKKWFNPKYWSSFYNLKEFMADNLGRQFTAMVGDVLENDSALPTI